MAEDTTKGVDQRSWPSTVIDNHDVRWMVTHTTTTRDVGLPSESVEHRWECEVRWQQIKFLVAEGSTQQEFDAMMNTIRQVCVDIRATIPAMA